MKKVVFLGLTFVLTSFVSTVVSAGSLENLERERSVAIATMLDSTIDVDARWNKLNISKRRLADLEVMVINDKKLQSSPSHRVKHSLSNYELTFLAHASVEHNKSVSTHWFDIIGLTTDQIIASKVSR